MFKNLRLKISLSILATACLPLSALAFQPYHFNDNYALTLIGSDQNEQFGSSILTVDINKDGFDDIAVGSPYYSENGKDKRGKVSVYLGPISPTPKVPNFNILGAQEGDLLGTSLAAGDINGDGFDDMLIGAPSALKETQNRSGAVYLFSGKSHFFLQNYDFSIYQPDLSIYGPHNNSYFGLSVIADDIDNDNNIDIIAGAPLAKNDDSVPSGNVYVMSWNSSFITTPFYYLSESAPTIFIPGQQSGSLFGSTLASGDFDGSDLRDLAIGAYAYSSNEKQQIGAVYLFLNFNQQTIYRKKPNNVFYGEQKNQWLGFNLNSISLNDDTKDDLSIASFSFKENLRLAKLWLIKGASSIKSDVFGIENLVPTNYQIIDESQYGIMLGSTVKSSDINQDGIRELIMTAPDIFGSSLSTVSIFEMSDFSQSSGKSSIFQKKPYTSISSNQAGDWFGQKLLIADFNRDGSKDLVITAPMHDSETLSNTGAVHVFFMRSGILQTEEPVNNPVKDNDALQNKNITRGEGVASIMTKFDFENKFSSFFDSCYKNLDFCLFVFSSQSKFDDISVSPDVILYPDVPKSRPHYKEINMATMLGLVNGNLSDAQSPFKPDLYLSRIQALKLIMEASILERNNFFKEIIDNMGGDQNLSKFQPVFDDVKNETPHMWWYFKYINLASQLGVLEKTSSFRPDDAITQKEFDDLLERMYKFAR